MRHILLTCAALALALPTASAQTRKVAFRTLCLEFSRDIQSVLLPGTTPAEAQTIPLFTDLSPVVEASFADNKVTFLLGGNAEGDKPEIAAQGRLAKSQRQLFLLVPNHAEGKPAYSIHCYDDDTRSFGMGHVRAINLAPVPVRFQLAGQQTPEIPPTKFAQFPHSKKVNGYNMYPVVVEFLSGNGSWVPGQSVSWKSTDRRREIVITLVDSKFNQPTVRLYSDFPPWQQPQEP